MLRAVLVDDELPNLQLLKMFLEKSGQVQIIDTFTEPLGVIENIAKLNPDVAFLDIEMPEMNGLELASKLSELNSELMIVFITGYSQYALEAFQVNALNYILKPVSEKKINQCVTRLLSLKGMRQKVSFISSEARINCLSNFEVYGHNGLIKWPTRKVEELFAYFIIYHNERIEGEVLGEELWPEGEPKKVKTNLHTSLYRLRKTLREEHIPLEIISEKGGKGIYCSQFGDVTCDFFQFEAVVNKKVTVEKNTIGKLEKILSLYKKDLFSNKNYHWVEYKKESLQRRYLQLIIDMATYYTKKGDYHQALEKLLLAEEKAPYDEDIHKKLLKVYFERKNKAQLINCHERFKHRLKVEMFIEPQKETVDLYNRLIEK